MYTSILRPKPIYFSTSVEWLEHDNFPFVSVYRFKDDSVKNKELWSRTLDVKCGWEKTWDPPILPPCVDPRGCPIPPPRNDRIWGSYEDDLVKSIDVGAVYWYVRADNMIDI